MSTNRGVDVGTASESFSGWTTTEVRFNRFADLSATRGEFISSPEFSCFGHQWRLHIYPGGIPQSREGYVAVFLGNELNIRNADGKGVVHHKSSTKKFNAILTPKNAWGYGDFAKRSKLMKLLINGSLVVEVLMKPTATDKSATHFVPTNPINKNMLELFMDEELAELIFEVGGGEQQAKGKRKKAKLSTTNFHAHRNILQKCAPTLYEMCGKSNEGGITTVSITDVKPETFKHMIYYAYGGKLSDKELKDNSKDIINACDKYGVVNLKLEAEACCVKSTEITMENMMDSLLYADSKNLALLKEAVMDYIVSNKHSIMDKVSFDDLPGSLMKDLLAAMARGEEQTGDGEEGESVKYNRMRVGTLRKMLDEKGLDVDGSREAMIALLKEQAA